jgi:hypothetical protein
MKVVPRYNLKIKMQKSCILLMVFVKLFLKISSILLSFVVKNYTWCTYTYTVLIDTVKCWL